MSRSVAGLFTSFLTSAFAVSILLHLSPTPAAADNSSFSVQRGVLGSSSKSSDRASTRSNSVVRTQDWPFNWNPDADKPITRVEIRLDKQRVYFFQGEKQVGDSPVSTGRAGYETPPGEYKVLVKETEHFSNLYGELLNDSGRVVSYSAEAGDPIPKGLHYQASPMPFYLRISDDGTGLHEGFMPGYAASHGCIRLPRKLAPLIFEKIPVGTPVIIMADDSAPKKVAKSVSPAPAN